jgi:rhamnulokinase
MTDTTVYHVAAVDLGATSGRVIVGTYANLRLTLQEIHRFPNAFHYLGQRAYWDLPRLFSEVTYGLKKAKEKVPEIASCGVDTWGVDYALLDSKGRLVFPTHAYRDSRTEPFFQALSENGIEKVFAWTGIQNLSFNTTLQLQEALTSCPGLANLAVRCLLLPDYFNYLLSGRQENEISILSTGQLLDVKSNDLSSDTLKFFGIPPQWFGQPALSPRKLGTVTGIEGLEDMQVILVPGHDTSCAYDAMPSPPGSNDIFLSSGTWSLIGFESDQPVIGAEALANQVSNERLGSGRYRPIKNCLGLWLLEQTMEAFPERPITATDWTNLISAAVESPPLDYLLDVTDRTLFNPKSMKDAIDAQIANQGKCGPGDLAGYTRLICDSLGQGHANAIRAFETMTGRVFDRILIVGGGSKNSLLCQATADASGLPVCSFNLEGTAVGNIANQLVAIGAVPDLDTFRQNLAMELTPTVYQPQTR